LVAVTVKDRDSKGLGAPDIIQVLGLMDNIGLVSLDPSQPYSVASGEIEQLPSAPLKSS
jgi:hypothetical protein